METTGRVLLCGENNPYGANPEFALYCYPPGCAGYRLRRIFGLPEDQYLTLHRKNLCDGDWSKAEAKKRAADLLDPHAPWDVIVLLGRKVTDAFTRSAIIDETLLPFSTRACCPGMTLVSLPHPSGANAGSWSGNKPRDRAREIMRQVAPELPWGSIDAEEQAA